MIMRHYDERLVRTTAIVLDYLTHEAAVAVIEAMKRFVKNQKLWVLDEGTGQQAESLLSATKL